MPIGPLKNAADANWQQFGADRFEEETFTIGEQLKSFFQLTQFAKSPISLLDVKFVKNTSLVTYFSNFNL